jgi:DNA-binding Lrp family transcriptional regulator
MPRAFVLINVESGSEDEVLRELKQMEGVEEAYFSYGVYDLIIADPHRARGALAAVVDRAGADGEH